MSDKTSTKIVPVPKNSNCSQAVLIDKTLRHLIAMAGAANEGIAILDNNAMVKFANPAFTAMHGYENQKQIIGKAIDSFQNTDTANSPISAFIDEIRKNKQFCRRFEHVKCNGHVFPAKTRIVLLNDAQNNPDGFLVFVDDLTEQIRAEKS
ncbi:MAG: PAS domain-containing protein, partial [Phycisphaerae bacterium]